MRQHVYKRHELANSPARDFSLFVLFILVSCAALAWLPTLVNMLGGAR